MVLDVEIVGGKYLDALRRGSVEIYIVGMAYASDVYIVSLTPQARLFCEYLLII